MTTQQALLDLIRQVTRDVHPRYAGFVEADDIHQEVAVYAFGDGWRRLERLIEAGSPGYAYTALHSAARLYCEQEKARVSGYSYGDVAWYTPDKLAGVVELALDPGWDGLTGEDDTEGGRGGGDAAEGGGLLAAVVDCRRALAANPAAAHTLSWAGGEVRREALRVLAEWLGGARPQVAGRRKEVA